MASWILIACAKSLFAEFDEIAPGRDHASDGSIGDAAHQQEVSDHNPDETGSVPIHDADHINEVHAIDVDSDLRTPGLTMEAVVQFMLGRCRSGAEKRLRYIIYNRRIWEADNSWKQRAYTGASAHTEHAHFSFSYTTSLEASTASWHLEDIPVALTSADKTWIQQQIAAVTAFDKPQEDGTPTSKIGRLALTQGIPNGTRDGEPRDQAWQVIADLGKALVGLQAKVDELSARLGDPASPASVPQPR
jgi:hypothetical protein